MERGSVIPAEPASKSDSPDDTRYKCKPIRDQLSLAQIGRAVWLIYRLTEVISVIVLNFGWFCLTALSW